MTRVGAFVPAFVDYVPEQLDVGVLYISIKYAVMVHLCASGCGEKVVLPLHPGQWKFTFDGASVSVWPSVGNVGIPCNSHYWIDSDGVRWSYSLSDEDAARGRARDRRSIDAGSPPDGTQGAPRRQPKKKHWLSPLLGNGRRQNRH